ncbi:hypothetical protein FDECE_14640 [Fusarium decemcellulare]|nr:hypothetical protein FDECE_14640 [Fusarium decemcellulare]
MLKLFLFFLQAPQALNSITNHLGYILQKHARHNRLEIIMADADCRVVGTATIVANSPIPGEVNMSVFNTYPDDSIKINFCTPVPGVANAWIGRFNNMGAFMALRNFVAPPGAPEPYILQFPEFAFTIHTLPDGQFNAEKTPLQVFGAVVIGMEGRDLSEFTGLSLKEVVEMVGGSWAVPA